MTVLVDTSALGKLLVEEAESAALRQHLAQGSAAGQRFVVSEIATVELRRLAIRLGIESERVERVLHPFTAIRLTQAMLQLAGRLPQQHLGTLDAIHIATAIAVEARQLLTYDQRQREAAGREGLATPTPGAS